MKRVFTNLLLSCNYVLGLYNMNMQRHIAIIYIHTIQVRSIHDGWEFEAGEASLESLGVRLEGQHFTLRSQSLW